MNEQYNFEKIIAPCTKQQFWDEYWEQKPLYIPRNNRDYYRDVLDISNIDILLQNQRLRAGRDISLVNQGQVLDYSYWVKDNKDSQDNFHYSVDNNKLYSLLHQGNTLVIKGGHKYIPKLISFCDRLIRELQFKLQTNIYITPPSAQGFAPHYDDHDVIVLQLEGTKLWRIYHTPIELPSPKQKDTSAGKHQLDKPTLEIALKPGDLLYIPRGFIHEAFTTDTNSIHITLGLLPTYYFELLQQLVEQAQDDERFRRAIPHPGATEKQLHKFNQEFSLLTQEIIAKLHPQSLLEKQKDRFFKEQVSSSKNRFEDWLKVRDLNLSSLVFRRDNINFMLEKDSKQITIKFNQQQLSFPVFFHASLTTILDKKEFVVRDIDGLINDSGKIKLVKQFIQAGFLSIEKVNSSPSRPMEVMVS